MGRKPIALGIVLLWLGILSCSIETSNPPVQDIVSATLTAIAQSAGALPAQGQPPTATSSPVPPGATAVPTNTACAPTATANLNANVRKGPGTVYDAVGALLTGQSAPISGKNADGTWWYITFPSAPGGYGWIAGSTVSAACVPASLAVIAAPPTPVPASGTCKGSYVWRLITPSDKVCVSPAAKAQADADNSAAASRLCTATYGPDTCAQG